MKAPYYPFAQIGIAILKPIYQMLQTCMDFAKAEVATTFTVLLVNPKRFENVLHFS
jgi:hypothetical protein